MGKICLIGYMGCGKTTIGMALAERLKWQWLDLDEEIVKKEKCSIRHLFDSQGEEAFREKESECLQRVLEATNDVVISTGGGVITTPKNRKLLQQTETIYLVYPFEHLYERIKGDKARPLVTTREALHKRFEERKPLYEASSTQQISCAGKSINDIVEEILKKLEMEKH